MNIKKLIIGILAFSLLSSVLGFVLFGYIGKKIFSSGDAASGLLQKLGGSEMGNQPAQCSSGMFCPNGKYYVYTYEIRNVNQYSRRGGATFSSGTVTSYVQVIDCVSGKPLLAKPVRSREILTIVDVGNEYVWFNSYKISDRTTAALYRIGDEKLKFTGAEIINLHPGLPLQDKKSRLWFYENTSGSDGAIVEAIDGRQYLIHPETGKLSILNSSGSKIDAKDGDDMYVESRLARYDLKQGTRQKVLKKDRSGVTSQDDFINPRFLILKKSDGGEKSIPMLYKNYFFLLSAVFTTSEQKRQLTMMDSQSLETIWTLDLPQGEQEMNNYKKERFYLEADRLFAANATNFLTIDLNKGTIVKNVALFGE